MPHYDRRNAALGPGVFTLADARGNNPHGTTETADAEGRRRNAGRYETVGQLDRALDARQAALARMPPLGAPRPSSTQGGAAQGDGLFGLLVVVALAVGATYVLATRARTNGADDDDDEDDVVPSVPIVPALSAPAVVQPIVVMPPAPAAAPVIVNPAPVVIDVVAEPARSRRRSRKAHEVVTPAVVTVTPTPTST